METTIKMINKVEERKCPQIEMQIGECKWKFIHERGKGGGRELI